MQTADNTRVLPIVRGPSESPRCHECPFGKARRAVPGEGPYDPAWIIIGEGPGENERRTGRPFIGASGQLLGKALRALGVERERLWVTNALLCTPPGASDDQKKAARACCAPRLQMELADLPNVPIAALGGLAAQGLLGDKFSITKMAGALYDIDLGHGERAIIPTIHPAAILRGGAGSDGAAGAHGVDMLYWNLIYDLGKVDRLAQGKVVRFTDDVETEHEDPARAEELIYSIVQDARAARIVAVDTETTSLRPLEAELTAISFATPARGVSVTWNVVTRRARRLMSAVLGDVTVRKVIQNRLYDRPILERYGMPVRGPCDDTLLMHHNAFPGLAHDLQRVATQFFAISPWKAEFRAGGGEPAELTKYNARDALATVRLYAPLTVAVKKAQAERTYEIDLVMAEYAERMHVAGFPIDLEINQALAERFRAEIDRSRQAIESAAASDELRPLLLERLAFEQAKRYRKGGKARPADPPGFHDRWAVRLEELKADPTFAWNINSPEHIAAYLRARGVPLTFETKTGKASTKKEVLESLIYLPEVAGLIDYREAEKMLSTFVESVGRARGADGRVHPRWNVHMITGRWSAEDPQAQNWPKANPRKNRPNLRSQVVAPKGRILTGFDFSQLEARIIALESGDPWLCEVFSHPPDKYGPGDIHSAFARMVWSGFDTFPSEEKSQVRDFIKRTEYGAMYGGVVDTLHKNLLKDDPNVRRADVERVVTILQHSLGGVNRWHEELMVGVAKPPHEVRESILGRRRVFPLGQASITDVYNFPVQAAAASLMALALMRLMPTLPPRTDMILQVHDAAYFETDEDKAEKVAELISTHCYQERESARSGKVVKFPIDVHIGRSWAEL